MKRFLAIALLLVSSTAIADWKLISTGTAFVVNKNYAVTAAHVLEDCDAASIRYKHKEIDAEIARLQAICDSQAYARNRKAEYDQLNQFEMQFDDDRDSTTTWVDKINEIKGRHPK